MTAALFLVLALTAAGSSFARVTIAPHRAVYDLEMMRARERSGIRDVHGRMVIEIDGNACDGWSIGFRLVNDYQISRGRFRMVDTRSTSWESGDGLNMRYFEREFIDNRPAGEVRIAVLRDKLDKPSVIVQEKPRPVRIEMPAGALFPIAHQIRLIEAARAGKTRDKSIVYDGSDRQNIYQAITFIGKKHSRMKPAGKQPGGSGSQLLEKTSYWPVTVAYYLTGKGASDGPPSHQVSFNMYENGIAGDLVLDYGDFALKGNLTRIDRLETGTGCK